MSDLYDAAYEQSLADPQQFWAAAAADVRWDLPWDTVLDDSRKPFYRWFAGGTLTLATTRSISMLTAAALNRLP